MYTIYTRSEACAQVRHPMLRGVNFLLGMQYGANLEHLGRVGDATDNTEAAGISHGSCELGALVEHAKRGSRTRYPNNKENGWRLCVLVCTEVCFGN